MVIYERVLTFLFIPFLADDIRLVRDRVYTPVFSVWIFPYLELLYYK